MISSPGLRERNDDKTFRIAVLLIALASVALCAALGIELAKGSSLAWAKFGFSFLTGREWNPVTEQFGALPFIYGTAASSLIALLISVPLGIGSAIFLAEIAPRKLSAVLCFMIELLAAIPSVIIGLMGIFVLVPAVRWIEPFLTKHLSWLPFFTGAPYGVGLLAAGLILSVMMLPYITSISRELLLAVPQPLKEGMLGLGSTRWEMVRHVCLPYARSGILGAVFLALGRALGETMAVTMVIGNTPKISLSLLAPAYTMSAVIANELAEATSDIYTHSLVGVALALFLITFIVNGVARLLVRGLTEEHAR
jgi:phosphate transport system permease protein